MESSSSSQSQSSIPSPNFIQWRPSKFGYTSVTLSAILPKNPFLAISMHTCNLFSKFRSHPLRSDHHAETDGRKKKKTIPTDEWWPVDPFPVVIISSQARPYRRYRPQFAVVAASSIVNIYNWSNIHNRRQGLRKEWGTSDYLILVRFFNGVVLFKIKRAYLKETLLILPNSQWLVCMYAWMDVHDGWEWKSGMVGLVKATMYG